MVVMAKMALGKIKNMDTGQKITRRQYIIEWTIVDPLIRDQQELH